MKEMLKIKFVKFEKALAMQISEQDESLRCVDDILYFETIIDGIKFKLISHDYPMFGKCENTYELYLRGGCEKYDFDIKPLNFDSNDERDKFLKNILIALERFKANNYFKGVENKETSKNDETNENDTIIVSI